MLCKERLQSSGYSATVPDLPGDDFIGPVRLSRTRSPRMCGLWRDSYDSPQARLLQCQIECRMRGSEGSGGDGISKQLNKLLIRLAPVFRIPPPLSLRQLNPLSFSHLRYPAPSPGPNRCQILGTAGERAVLYLR
jgi:hypothetical protein